MGIKKKTCINTALTISSVIIALVLFDLALMPFNLVFNSANLTQLNFEDPTKEQLQTISQEQFKQWSQPDPILGYLPRMGKKYAYSNLGTQHNSFALKKTSRAKRILMMGDSIAAIGFLGKSLTQLAPGEKQIWNGGVFGYSTFQEVLFFERYLRKINPDLVVLEFCLNDFDGTPVILKSKKEETLVAKMYLGADFFSPWLFRHSTIYRIWLSLKKSLFHRPGLKEDVKKHLARLLNLSEADGFKLLVVVYPLFQKPGDWPNSYRKQHQAALDILNKLGIRHYDAKELLEKMLKTKGLAYTQLSTGDFFHPSRAFCRALAKELISKDLLR